MSKMDALRAMREAKYEAAQKAAQKTAQKTTKTTRKVAEPPPVAPAAPRSSTTPDAPASDALCGHRNMSGRTCTREHGHAAKSHRYS